MPREPAGLLDPELSAEGTPANPLIVLDLDKWRSASPAEIAAAGALVAAAGALVAAECRPDVKGSYDDGGLVGINHVPDRVLAGQLGMTQREVGALTQPVSALAAPQGCEDHQMEILSSRILLRPADLDRSRRFYRDVLGLAVYREFGPETDPGTVFFLGQGMLEVSGHGSGAAGSPVMIWLQVRDVRAEHGRLAAAGVRVLREPATEPWGLTEMWIEDPDGVRIVLVEVPADHPLRRDRR